jgi:hypothetical protein|tara:strand:- start:606 stop:932 length:327 start_codon:yes stop_codon:yes gene_type:complete
LGITNPILSDPKDLGLFDDANATFSPFAIDLGGICCILIEQSINKKRRLLWRDVNRESALVARLYGCFYDYSGLCDRVQGTRSHGFGRVLAVPDAHRLTCVWPPEPKV